MYVSMDYLAKQLNVSKATISRVINNQPGVSAEKRKQILEALQEYRYQMTPQARSQSNSRTKIIAVIVPDLINPFFPQIIQAIETYAAYKGILTLIVNTSGSIKTEVAAIRNLIAVNVDGIILTTAERQDTEGMNLLKKNKVPTVLLDRKVDEDNQNIVGIYTNNEYAVFLAVDKLVKMDKCQPVIILGGNGISTSEERLNGYKEALKYNNIWCNEDYIVNGNYSYQSGYDAIGLFHQRGIQIKSVMACNDMMAVGAMAALKNQGLKIPEDVDVIGFDDIQICEIVSPKLTTVSQPVNELGVESAKTLIKLIDGEQVKQHSMSLDVKLVIRESTKKM